MNIRTFINQHLIALAIMMTLVIAPVYAESDNGYDQRREAHSTGSALEIHINDNGSVLVRGAKVTAVSGTTVSAITSFGTSATIMWTIDARATPKIVRRYGGNSTISDIQVGDYISFSGALSATGSGFTVTATSIKDWSIQVRNSSFSGTISAITGTNLVLTYGNNKSLTVMTDANTVITRDGTPVAFSALIVGDNVTKTEGLYNTNTNTLMAKTIKLQSNPLLSKRTFEGTLQSPIAVGTVLPTTFSFLSEGKTYTVNVPAGISILNKDWMQIPLTTFQMNDTVRIYGLVQASNTSVINATVVRNTTR